MSLVTKQYRVSVPRFAAVPPLLHLPGINRLPASVSGISSYKGRRGVLDLAEGCMLTKSIKYTHKLWEFINAPDGGDPTEVEGLVDELRVVPTPFKLTRPCNQAYLEAFVYASVDVYALVAVTASSSTLDALLEMVKSDNQRRQLEMDERGFASRRSLNFSNPSFLSPEYELVALHPEHFLPDGSKLTIYDPSSATSKDYVPAADRCLRESVDPNAPRLPPFRHLPNTARQEPVNIFLVILNAENIFHQYLEMVLLNPPAKPLPDDVLDLMCRTIELVHLLYWKPVPAKGSKGEQVVAEELAYQRQQAAGKDVEEGSSKELAEGERVPVPERDESPPSKAQASSRHKLFRLPEGVGLEARKRYGRAKMSRRDVDHDLALYGNAVPINETPDNERTTVETKNETVGSERSM